MKTILCFLLFAVCWHRSESQCKGKLCFEGGCLFNGIYYQAGDVIKDVCFDYRCNGNFWQPDNPKKIINGNCNICRICNDPHFRTFDHLYNYYDNYNWHGVCNYSLSQPFCVDGACSYSPNYAVYGDFAKCSYNTAVSCLDSTTYKVDPFTAILLQHNKLPDQIEINNNAGFIPSDPQTPFNCDTNDHYPCLIWKKYYTDNVYGDFTGGCTFILAHNFSMIACQNCIFILTLPTHMKQINGLCGYYDGDVSNEFIKRDDCSLNPDSIPSFASSWTTLQQNDDNKCCPQSEINGDFSSGGLLKVACATEEHYANCKSAAEVGFKRCTVADDREVELIAQDCVTDCCGDPRNAKNWTALAGEVAFLHCEVLENINREIIKE